MAIIRISYGSKSGVKREFMAKLGYLGTYCVCISLIILGYKREQVCDFAHLFLLHAASGECRRAYTYAGCYKWRLGVIGDGVFIYGYVHIVKAVLKFLTGYVFVAEIDKHEVIVGAS